MADDRVLMAIAMTADVRDLIRRFYGRGNVSKGIIAAIEVDMGLKDGSLQLPGVGEWQRTEKQNRAQSDIVSSAWAAYRQAEGGEEETE